MIRKRTPVNDRPVNVAQQANTSGIVVSIHFRSLDDAKHWAKNCFDAKKKAGVEAHTLVEDYILSL